MKKKTIIIMSAVNALFIALIIVSLITIRNYRNELSSQQAAEFWKGESEENFSQVSCFFPENAKIDENSILTFRSLIDTKLTEAGIKLPKEGSVWTDAYSSIKKLGVEGDQGTSDATAIGVGADYFMFHPYELVSGSYLSDTDIMQDRVVLDYNLAWKLFGSSDLNGMFVKIGGKPYYVAGVVKCESDKFTEKAFSGEPIIFMSYTAFSEQSGSPSTGSASTGGESVAPDSTSSGEEAGTPSADNTAATPEVESPPPDNNTSVSESSSDIVCYELCMPEPISGFAATLVKENLASDSGIVVENNTRYSFESIIKLFTDFGSRSISNTPIAYPYWENAARVSEVYIARIYAIIALLAIFPLCSIVWLIVLFIKFLKPKLRKVKAGAIDAWDDRYARMDELKKRRKKRNEQGGKHIRIKRVKKKESK